MEIHWVGVREIPEDDRERAEERLEYLADGHDDLIDLRITGRPSRHHRHGGQEVRITCQARGREIVAARTRDELSLALHDALEAFEQGVHRMRDRRRDRSRAGDPEPANLGIVDRVFRADGYGFILTDDGEQVYFHRNAVKEGLDFERLEEADRVALSVEPGRDGPQASSVHAPPPGER